MLASRWKLLLPKRGHCRRHFNVSMHGSQQDELEANNQDTLPSSSEWYRKSYPKLMKMAQALKHVDQVDGRVIDVDDNNSTITDDRIVGQLQTFKSIAKAFVGSPAMQQALLSKHTTPIFARQEERTTMTLDSLTKVCNFLHVSAQQRKAIRLTLCRQITQQHIWRGALLELLEDLRSEMTATLRYERTSWSSSWHMCEQIVLTCAKLLADKDSSPSPLWMQLSSSSSKGKNKNKPPTPPLRRWEEVLEMFGDLTEWMGKEQELLGLKIEAMKEGLYQIKDVVIEREIGCKEARRQDCLVQRRLSTSLGHSSRCLFTLLLYYLYGTVRDVQVDACGLYGSGVAGGQGALLCVGKVLTSDDGRMVLAGVKQLDRALALFRFVWETANMKGVLRLQGHLWFVGADDRILTYRGTTYSLHGLRL